MTNAWSIACEFSGIISETRKKDGKTSRRREGTSKVEKGNFAEGYFLELAVRTMNIRVHFVRDGCAALELEMHDWFASRGAHFCWLVQSSRLEVEGLMGFSSAPPKPLPI